MAHSYPRRVHVVEVGPRDGLQNESAGIALATKVALCDRLSAAGLPEVEAAAFVSPRWVPQMADSARLMAAIERRPATRYSVLVPNMKGLESALQAKADAIVVFGAATESFSRKNINCSIAESIERFGPVAEAALAAGLRVRGSISCCLGCPYEGEVSAAAVAESVKRMVGIGCQEIDIADTIGVGTPVRTTAVFEAAARELPIERLAGHFHDTYGQALANVHTALLLGVPNFHSSVAGLGGCPYAHGATGNLASEDLVYMLHGLGIETGIDLQSLSDTGRWISAILKRPNGSRAGQALTIGGPGARPC